MVFRKKWTLHEVLCIMDMKVIVLHLHDLIASPSDWEANEKSNIFYLPVAVEVDIFFRNAFFTYRWKKLISSTQSSKIFSTNPSTNMGTKNKFMYKQMFKSSILKNNDDWKFTLNYE